MDRAINKTTGEVISAFEVFKNGSYQNLNKGEWTAPQDSIYNWEELEKEGITEIPVHYTTDKEFTNFKGTIVSCAPYFGVYPESQAKTIEESPQHKILKDWLFSKLKLDDLEMRYSKASKPHRFDNKTKLSELPIDWKNYDIEVSVNSYKKLRADVLLPFFKKDIFLGKGIVFEIQLSKQNEDITNKRSIFWALNGYSTIWLFENDFIIEEDNIKLKEEIVNINSFSSELNYNNKQFVNNLKIAVEEQCRFLDNKKIELENKTLEIDNYKEEIIDIIKKEIEGFFGYKIKELSQNFNQVIADKVQNEFFEKNKEKLLELIYFALPKVLEKEVINNLVKSINIDKITNYVKETIYSELNYKIKKYEIYKELISSPPLCNGCGATLILDNGQYGLWWRCPNFPQCKSKNRHAIPQEVQDIFKERW